MSDTELCQLVDIPDNNAKGMVAKVEGKKRRAQNEPGNNQRKISAVDAD